MPTSRGCMMNAAPIAVAGIAVNRPAPADIDDSVAVGDIDDADADVDVDGVVDDAEADGADVEDDDPRRPIIIVIGVDLPAP
jgi:hypothetical protein